MVDPSIQKLIWETYRTGQEIDKQPSQAYLVAQRTAVWQVFADEGCCTYPDIPEIGTDAYMIGPAVLRASPRQSSFFDGATE